MPSSAQAARTAGCGRPPNSCCGGEATAIDIDAGGLGGDHVHHDGRRVGDEAAGHVDAGPLDRDEPGGDGQPLGGQAVPALGELRLVDHAGAAGGLFECVPDGGVDRGEGVADGFFWHPGMREVHAVEAARVLADGRAAADAHVLGDRLDEVHGAVNVEGGTRQHAGQGPAGEAGRVPSAQVNRVVTGLIPLSEVTRLVYERRTPAAEAVRMLDSLVRERPQVARPLRGAAMRRGRAGRSRCSG